MMKLMISAFSVLKRGFPNWLKNDIKDLLNSYKEYKLIHRVPQFQRAALSKLRDKPFIRCVFFVSEIADWKCDTVYKLMQDHPRFQPSILICPVVNYGNEMMISEMEKCCSFFQSHGYDFRIAFDREKGEYLDVRKELNPDFIFYTCPYEGQSDPRFFITNYLDILGAYVPYGFNNNIELNYCYNLLFHNILWRYYVESNDHKKYAQIGSRNKGRNTVVSGYPAIDPLINKNYTPKCDSWKISDKPMKRIIWAPHHTIQPEGSVAYSCFLQYSDYMLEMAQKYKDVAQFVFKPHPLLREKLNLLWGIDTTNLYYKKWRDMPNTSLAEGDYVDLFLTSDAMIHDSGSFIIEYLYVNKPVMRTLNDIPLEKMYNSFTLKCFNQYYFAKKTEDVDIFIHNLINDIDPLKEQRSRFVGEFLMPEGSPSQNIIDDILDSIDNQTLYRN